MFSLVPALLLAQSTTPISVGMTEVAGKFNQTYRIGTSRKLDVTLLHAAFSGSPFAEGKRWHYPKKQGKFVVFRFRLSNPNSNDWVMSNSTYHGFKATIIDSESATTSSLEKYAVKTGASLTPLTLKPKQSVEVWSIMEVAATNDVPTLLVSPGDGGKGADVKYDLRGKIGALPKWSQRSQPYEMAENVVAENMTLYPIGKTLFSVAGHQIVPESQLSKQRTFINVINKGHQFVVVHCAIRGTGESLGGAQMWRPKIRLGVQGGQQYQPLEWLRTTFYEPLNEIPAVDRFAKTTLVFLTPPGAVPYELTVEDSIFGRNFLFEVPNLPDGPTSINPKRAEMLGP